MTRQQRAKQFQPFDAMKGLKEAISAVEERRARVDKRLLEEDDVKAVNKALIKIEKGMRVEIEWRDNLKNGVFMENAIPKHTWKSFLYFLCR